MAMPRPPTPPPLNWPSPSTTLCTQHMCALHPAIVCAAAACAWIITPKAHVVNQSTTNTYDYIVIRSGPDCGSLVACLTQAGFSILLIDARDNHGKDSFIQVPTLQAQASEYTPIHWQYSVSHFNNLTQAQKDSKFTWQQLCHAPPTCPN
ncbi:hypothetical protein BDQ17DRAFT_1437089 [Cyathus striatus]|nr:hypothetical protein BDQ17DRAFT_1437089 [Cyathus striatus]